MDERRVAEYFVVAGLPPNPTPLAEFSCDGANLKSTHSLPPVTDIIVVNRTLLEVVPDGYACIETTPGGVVANLNHGVLRSQEMFLCYRRGRDKPPLVDIGVLLEGRERLLPDSQVVEFTVGNHCANINPNGVPAYITYRRATEESTCNELVVSDICIIMTSKGETAPHSYCTIYRNLNKGTMVGSDIFLCYRKSVNRTNYLAYEAGILDQYPLLSRPNFPVPDNLALFCLPMGATMEAWPPQAASPDIVFSTFVLTIQSTSGSNSQDGSNEGVDKVYGAAITFYESYPHIKLTEQQREDLQLNDHFGRRNIIHTNKCICILSMWPFFDTFERFLKYLHKMVHSANHKVPVERYIWHLLECVPFPSPARPRILIQLHSQEGISLAQLEDSPISLSGASFRKLVMCLRPEGCLLVLLYALTEQKILLHSLRPDVLTAVAEALTMIIFPFHWQCPYIPLCPLGLSDLLDAPTPFLLGFDSRFFDLYDPPPDVICIDLDTAAISIPEDKRHLTTKLLPKKAARILKSSLDSLCSSIKVVDDQLQQHHLKTNLMLDHNNDKDFKIKRKEQELEVEIQETFLRFTATVLRGYSLYLLPIVTVKPNVDSGTSLFDVEGFVRSRDKSYQKFYEMMVNTQMFSRFIEERSFVSDKDISLVFFDDCIEKVKDEEVGSRLLEIEHASSEKTFVLLPPEPPVHAPIDGYAYEGFPKLRHDLFPVMEPSKTLPSEIYAPLKVPSGVGSPGSPLARRSKREVKSAQKLASKHYQTPILWAKCLLSTCFSLWFAHLPAFISTHAQKARVLDLAFHILQRMQRLSLSQQDEVCYRVMMQLCGVYSKPVLAVKTLCEMRNSGIRPDAITYGYYNRALLESKWNPSNLLWNKLRNVMLGVTAFRQSGLERAERRKSSLSLDELDKMHSDNTSRLSLESGTSLESHPAAQCNKTDTLSSDPGYCSISENCEHNASSNVSPTSNTICTLVSSAGLLMTSPLDGSFLDPARPYREKPTDLAEHLSKTLEKYDQIQEPSMPVPTTFDPSHTDRGPPEYLRSNSYGKDEKIVKKLLQLVYPAEDPLAAQPSTQGGSDSTLAISPKGKYPSSQEEKTDNHDDQKVNRKTSSEDGFEDYDDEEDGEDSSADQTLNTGVKSFFSRNTPDRLSNLWRKGVLGADEKLREIWRKTTTGRATGTPIKSGEGKRKTASSDSLAGNNPKKPEAESMKPLKIPSDRLRTSYVKKKKPVIVVSASSEDEKKDSMLSSTDVTSAVSFSNTNSEATSSSYSPLVSPNELIEGSGRHEVLAGDPLGALGQDTIVTDSLIVHQETKETDPSGVLSQEQTDPLGVRSQEETDPLGVLNQEQSDPLGVLNQEQTGLLGSRSQEQTDPLGVLNQYSASREDGHPRSCRSSAQSLLEPSLCLSNTSNNASKILGRSNTFTNMSSTIKAEQNNCSKKTSSTSLLTLNPPFSGEEFQSSRNSKSSANPSNSSVTNGDSLMLSWPAPFKLPLSGTSTFDLASSVATEGFRQASKHIETIRAQYIDPAITELASQSNFNYRKELFSGSLNSMRSAVTSLSKKYNIIREAIIPTPSRLGWRMEDTEEDLVDGFWGRRESYDASEEANMLRRSSLKPAPEEVELDRSLPSSWNVSQGPFCLGIWITSCSRCHNCKGLLYDEEIMAGWRPDDSNLNTRCWHCNKLTVPLLTVTLYYLRHLPKDVSEKYSVSTCKGNQNSTGSSRHGSAKRNKSSSRIPSSEDIIAHVLDKGKRLEPLTFPYLSPLVLRKELETLLGHEGDACLTSFTFADHHPILYWNMLWYFSRLCLPSHLPGLCLSSLSLLKDKPIHESWEEADWRHVYVRCQWDNTLFHQELGSPLYMQWKENYNPSVLVKALTPHRAKTPKDVLESFLTLLHVNQVDRCVDIMVQSMKKRPADLKYNHFPVYRDLLFFALTALPRSEINIYGFEQEFRREFEKTFPRQFKILNEADAAPPIPAVFCRKFFLDLSL